MKRRRQQKQRILTKPDRKQEEKNDGGIGSENIEENRGQE